MEGLIGVFLLGLIIYLIIRYPLRALSPACKLSDHLRIRDRRDYWTVCTPNELIGLHRRIPL